MKLLSTKSTQKICKRVASNIDKILFPEFLLLQGEVAHQKHYSLFSGQLLLFGQVEVKAPQLFHGLVHTHNPFAELAHLFEFLIALYKN